MGYRHAGSKKPHQSDADGEPDQKDYRQRSPQASLDLRECIVILFLFMDLPLFFLPRHLFNSIMTVSLILPMMRRFFYFAAT
jgi:hypothetical protein